MPISEIYEELRQIALSDYGDIVVQVAIIRLPTGDPLKLRLNLVDGSLIDVHLSVSGRYSYHWDRRMAGKEEIYRHDNAPHTVWQYVTTFPRHFHDGREDKVTESYINPEPTEALRQICVFARQKLRQEARS
jgi:hypothetical protein